MDAYEEQDVETEKTIEQKKANDEISIISPGFRINGSIYSEGSVDILGNVDGEVEVLGKLNVSGQINGNAVAGELYCEGAVIKGNVTCTGAAKIGAGSIVLGDIKASGAAIAGAVNGDIDVPGLVVLDSTAIIMGNIKSKSVQINNGAIVEGMCSQCYAEVSPAGFFEEYKQKM